MISGIVAKHFKKKLDNLTIKEEDVTDVLREIRITLLDGDVNLQVVKLLIKNIREKIVGTTIENGANPQNVLLGIIKTELTNILGKNVSKIAVDNAFISIMLVGLQGSGKTTSCAKLAYMYKTKHQKKVLLVGVDIYRPAAIEQLRTLAQEINVEFFERGTQNPVITVSQAQAYAKQNGFNVVIYDTAGRLQTNNELMSELKNIRNCVSPNEILLVVDAMSGQNVVDVATTFNNTLSLSGFIVTKLDGDARAGAALSLTCLINVPIKMIGTGEKVGSLDQFYPERMAERILGLGDILTLAEKANEVIDQNQVKRTFTRMLAGKMDLEDLMIQLNQVSKMGSLDSIMKFMPGNLSEKISENQMSDAQEKIRVYQIILNSMTLKERRNPTLFKKESTRKARVVKVSGRKPEEFNKLINE
jgi:signal recognition particle subunit SRP54